MALTSHLSPGQAETLAALVDTIVPADEYPSGTEAGVLEYLDAAFAADLAEHREWYRLGLDALDAEARAVHATPFAALRPGQRESLLRTIESGGERVSGLIEFLAGVVEHVMEGFYTNPVAWDMVGFRVSD